MAVLVRRRVVDRCVVGCCGWNYGTYFLTWTICYGVDHQANHPFYRTFRDPAPDEWLTDGGIISFAWICCCIQIPCAVDCVVGPILVNAADCCVTCGCCTGDDPESCCCVACAGGLKQFDRLHWSLWDYSPFRQICCFHNGVKPMSDERWKRVSLTLTTRTADGDASSLP